MSCSRLAKNSNRCDNACRNADAALTWASEGVDIAMNRFNGGAKCSLVPFYADAGGAIYDAPGYRALARSGDDIVPMDERQVIALPEGSTWFFLPERPVVIADKKGRQEKLASTLYAVGLFCCR